MVKDTAFVVTCEHGGNDIPAEYRSLFEGEQTLLNSHRGYDAGALEMAHDLAEALKAPLVISTTSRLFVDLNRSPSHPNLHSQFVRHLPEAELLKIKSMYYEPYRNHAQSEVVQALEQHARVIHISSHSFTPVLNGTKRNADIGLLYDSARKTELKLCEYWKSVITAKDPSLRVRRNYPYAGKSDGLCTWMRKHFPPNRYLGIELEINQKHVLRDGVGWQRLRLTVISALLDAAETFSIRENAHN